VPTGMSGIVLYITTGRKHFIATEIV
jgi:hypothetical protein